MSQYSNEEKFEMLECYIKCDRKSERAQDLYFHKYPNRTQPDRKIFRRLVMNLRTGGSFDKKRQKTYNINDVEINNAVLNQVAANRKGSVRLFSQETGVPKTTLHRIIKKKKLHPYKPTVVQKLVDTDYPRRRVFCNWYTEKTNEDNNFHKKIIWSDETRITNCGIFNKHNTHYWALENPHLKEERRSQTKFGTNVWCGMFG